MQSIKIHNYSIPGYGLYNWIGGYQVFIQGMLLLMACADTASMLVQTRQCHNQSASLSAPQILCQKKLRTT